MSSRLVALKPRERIRPTPASMSRRFVPRNAAGSIECFIPTGWYVNDIREFVKINFWKSSKTTFQATDCDLHRPVWLYMHQGVTTMAIALSRQVKPRLED